MSINLGETVIGIAENWLIRILVNAFNVSKSIRYVAVVAVLVCLSSTSVQAQQVPLQEECVGFAHLRQDISLTKKSRVDTNVFADFEGKTIRNIAFKSVDVFDEENPAERKKPFLLLNKLHINTKTNVVNSQLLFKSGDTVNAQAIHESERILRTRPYLTNAYILPDTLCGSELDVVVITQDVWALEPQAWFSRRSADNQTGFGISDRNILGSGSALTISYSENEQRNGIGYDFSNPHFLNREINFRVYYEDTSDGRDSLVDISKPFYALDTPWATGLHLEDVSEINTIWLRDNVINDFRHRTIINELFLGKATHIAPAFTQRWITGFTVEEERFFATSDTLQPIPHNEKLTYPWVEYQYVENRFGVYKNINQIQRPEDVRLGKNFSLRVGVGTRELNNRDEMVRLKANYTHIIDFSEKHIFEYQAYVNGRQYFHLNNMDSVIIGNHISYNYFQDEKNRWYSRIAYDAGQDLAQYQELTAGDLTGLRGYPTDYLRGKKRYVFSLERRYFSDVHLFNLMRIGGVVFLDVGKAWGLPDQSYTPLLSSLGVGLRFSSSKIRVGNVVHINVATPTSANEGISRYQVMIGAEQKF